MLDSIIPNNPFRMLGVYSNSSAKEIVANVNQAKAYLKVGRIIEFPADLNNYLPKINRTIEAIDFALSQINQAKEKIRYALFWFSKKSSFDEIALGYLNANNTIKALSILEKKNSYSSLLNRSIIAVYESDLFTAVKYYGMLIHEYRFREEFLSDVCGEKVRLSEEDLSHLLCDTLFSFFPSLDVVKAFEGTVYHDDFVYVQEKAISQLVNTINKEIAIAKSAEKSAVQQFEAGETLMNNTKKELQQLEQLSGSDNQYQLIVDNLAKQILQCGINYYNSSRDINKARKAYVLQKYAFSIAVGKLTKDRCKDNLSILEEIINNLPPEELMPISSSIADIIKRFNDSSKDIKKIIFFIKECSPYLADIRDIQGANGKYYIIASTRVEEVALNALIDIVNNAIKDYEGSSNNDTFSSLYSHVFHDKSYSLFLLKCILRDAWEAIAYLELLDITPSAGQRLISQKASLEGLLDQLKESTYLSPIKFRLESHADRQRLFDSISRSNSFNEAACLLPKCIDELAVSALDDKCFELCQTKSNYKKYVKLFGNNARHKSEAEEHFRFELMIINIWNFMVKHKGWFIFIAILLAIIIGIGVIWGIKGYTVLLWIIGILVGMAAFGMMNEKDGGCGTVLICLIIAAASIGGANILGDYNKKIEKEREEIAAFESLKLLPSISECQSFLSKYNNSSYKDEVLGIYFMCAEADGIESLNNFANNFSMSDWGNKASDRVSQLCDSLYHIAEEKNTVNGWKEYQASVPTNHYADSNEKIKIIESQAWNTESKAWNQATKENTISAYQKYLTLYPNGNHRDAADKKVIDLQVAQVYAGEHGQLPSMDQIGYGGGSTSSITITNSTSYTLTILYSGTDSKRVIISPNQTSYVTLKNGNYRVAASVSAHNVRNFAGSETLHGGSYSVEYYIVTSRY